jgi:hypothetical protein
MEPTAPSGQEPSAPPGLRLPELLFSNPYSTPLVSGARYCPRPVTAITVIHAALSVLPERRQPHDGGYSRWSGDYGETDWHSGWMVRARLRARSPADPRGTRGSSRVWCGSVSPAAAVPRLIDAHISPPKALSPWLWRIVLSPEKRTIAARPGPTSGAIPDSRPATASRCTSAHCAAGVMVTCALGPESIAPGVRGGASRCRTAGRGGRHGGQLDHLLQLGDGTAELPLSAVDHRHVRAGHRLAGRVPDLQHDRQRLLVLLQRPLPLAHAPTMLT